MSRPSHPTIEALDRAVDLALGEAGSEFAHSATRFAATPNAEAELELEEEFELVAAALHAGWAMDDAPQEEPNRVLLERIEADATTTLATRQRQTDSARSPLRVLASGGWLLAAAALLLLWLDVVVRSPAPLPSPAERLALLRTAEDTLALPWAHTEEARGAAASGEVVWSTKQQTGFLVFEGLAVNDPAVDQYQLWIFDGTRDVAHPVDGGVFDVLGDSVVVPIDPKLEVREPALFAVTIEAPGGVVVSRREHIVLTAAVP